MLLKKLSQVLGAISKGWAVDTFLGGFPVSQIVNAPANASNNAVLASTALDDGASKEVTAGISDPDHFRCLSITGNQPGIDGTVTILGKDWANRSISEQIVASGNSTVQGTRPFRSVDKITLPARDGSGDEIAVGTTNKFGLYRPLADGESNLRVLYADNSVDTVAAFDTTNDTFTPTTNPDGSRMFRAMYLTEFF